MTKDNYSHILFIKVWSSTSESASNYGNIESILKQKLLNNRWSFNGINLYFEKIDLSPMDKALGLSDIVVNVLYEPDDLVVVSLNNLIKSIEEELRRENKLNINDKIIFKLLKPFDEKI